MKEKTLKETQSPEKREVTPTEQPGPQGIGMAVAIDWGLAVQVFLTPIVALLPNQSSPGKVPVALVFVIAWPVSAGLALFGEMVRRGRNWTRWIQIVFNSLLTIGGIIGLFSLYSSLKSGNFWPLVTESILVIFSPLIVWRMSQSATANWFKTVSSADASKRHGGRWIFFIALWAVVGGLLQTIAASKH